MFAPFIEHRLAATLKGKTITVTKPQGKLELDADGYSPVELAKMGNAPSDDARHYRNYIARTKAKFGISSLELEGFVKKEEESNYEAVASAKARAEGGKLKKVAPGIWLEIRY